MDGILVKSIAKNVKMYEFDNCNGYVRKYPNSWQHTFKYLGLKVHDVC